MKHNYLRHIYAVLSLLCTTMVTAHDFTAKGIYYKVVSEENKTAKVTYAGNSYNSYKEYSGNVVIPEEVSYSILVNNYANWTSNNKNNDTTSKNEYTFNVKDGYVLDFDWSVSSENHYDILVITLDGEEIINKSGIQSGHYQKKFNASGSHKLVVKYTKDFSNSEGDDEGKIYNISLYDYSKGNYTVTAIDSEAFRGCSELTGVVIPGSVKTIGYYAFYDCDALKEVTIGDGVEYINSLAFYDCDALASISIPSSVKKIDVDAISHCYSLKDLRIEDDTTSLSVMYCDCDEDEYFGMFKDCSLKTVYMGRDINSTNASPFKDQTSITSFTVGKNVTSFEYNAFSKCNIENLYIQDLETWLNIEFYNNNSGNPMSVAKNIYINKSLVTDLYIPSYITTINSYAIYGGKFNSLTVDANNPKYDSRDNCNAIIEKATNTLLIGCNNTIIPNGVECIEKYAFMNCKGLTNIKIPASVKSIGNYAFNNCTNLVNIVIPYGVKSIAQGAFSDCEKLFRVSIPEGIEELSAYIFEGCTALTSAILPNSLTRIGQNAFKDCISLTDITIPDGVIYISDYAFYGCSSLTSVEIPNSVKSINSNVFSDCSGLTSVVIGNSVTSIGNYAFYNCTGLKEITSLIPAENLFTINYNVLFYKVNKDSCTLYVPYGAKEIYATTNGWKDFTNIVELENPFTEVTVTIDEYGRATYCSPYALDFSEVEGLKAYVATGYNTTKEVVTLTRIQTSKEGLGLFLLGEPGEYVVPIIDASSDYSLNLLVGTLENTIVNNRSDDGRYINFKYTIINSERPMFYPFEDGSTLNANNAYLQLPASLFPATASKAISMYFDNGDETESDNETTGIDELREEELQDIHDLSGRRISNITEHGVYIINGKKVIK